MFDKAGIPSGVYNKLHLVPFGEFLPGRRQFPWLVKILPIEDFTPGRQYKMFSLLNKNGEALEVGVLICFEDIFSDLASTFVRRGADVLVNITNDAWFGDTSSPYQHLASSIFRAVENRVYVARAANTGISCIIDDAGRIREIVADAAGKKTFVTGTQAGWIYRTHRQGLYAKLGDIFAYLCALVVTVVLFLRVRREYGKKNT
jgi:apolipoprotein N-acyltransferase